MNNAHTEKFLEKPHDFSEAENMLLSPGSLGCRGAKLSLPRAPGQPFPVEGNLEKNEGSGVAPE